MKKLIMFLYAGVMAFFLTACGSSLETPAPTVTEPTFTTEISTTSTSSMSSEETKNEDNKIEGMKQELLSVMNKAYFGLTVTGSPMYLVTSDDWSHVLFVLESSTEDTYIKFLGNSVVDEDGIITVKDDETVYTLGFTLTKQEDGSFFLNCGNLGECYAKQGKPSDVIDSIITVFSKKEDVTVKLMKAISEFSDTQKEILNYLNNDLKVLAQIDKVVVDGFRAVSGENYTDDRTMYNALNNEIRPNLTNLIEKAESVILQTQELKDIHYIYLSCLYKKEEAFALMSEALFTSNAELVTNANEIIAIANEFESEYLSILKAYANAHGVETTGI